jgi:hypothetical protein
MNTCGELLQTITERGAPYSIARARLARSGGRARSTTCGKSNSVPFNASSDRARRAAAFLGLTFDRSFFVHVRIAMCSRIELMTSTRQRGSAKYTTRHDADGSSEPGCSHDQK